MSGVLMKLYLCLLALIALFVSIVSPVHANDSALFNYTGGEGERYFKLQSSTDIPKDTDKNLKISDSLLDYTILSNITFKFLPAPKSNLNEGFSLKQIGEKLSLTGVSSGNLILKATSTISNTQIDLPHKTKSRDVLYTVSFEDASIMGAVKGGMANQKIENKILSFEVGDLSHPETFEFHLFAEKRRVILKNVMLIDRALKSGEYTVTDLGKGRNKVVVDLQKLVGNFTGSTTHAFRFSIIIKHDFSNVINSAQIGATTLEDTLIASQNDAENDD